MNLPVTVLVAVKNEEINIWKCLDSLGPAEKIYVVDSHSTDQTCQFADRMGVEIAQFRYEGGYPKKRQWALLNLAIDTPWILLLDADEVVPAGLWEEMASTISRENCPEAFLVTKGFHFLGKKFRYGGFSHSAVVLFKNGKARFEHVLDEPVTAPDMEVHERLIVDGIIGELQTPLIHQDFKGLEAYIARHNHYSTWEANVRYRYLTTGQWGEQSIKPRLFGNTQERRRFLKAIALRLPFEQHFWFCYHYFLKLGFLEGRPGLIAAQIRASYIAQVRAKLYELKKRSCEVQVP